MHTLVQVGAAQFCEVLQQVRGPEAVDEWRRLQEHMRPLSRAASVLPPVALRFDLGAFDLSRWGQRFWLVGWLMVGVRGGSGASTQRSEPATFNPHPTLLPALHQLSPGVLLTGIARYLPSLLADGRNAARLTGPFSKVRRKQAQTL